jgi:protein FAM32A
MSYESAGGSLKLKGVLDKKIKKKKKSKNSTRDLVISTVNKPDVNEVNSDQPNLVQSSKTVSNTKINKKENNLVLTKDETLIGKKPVRTKAEIEFEKAMEKRVEEKILKRAEKSHKEHVEVYNSHLDSLSEYNDIPKVSWTK